MIVRWIKERIDTTRCDYEIHHTRRAGHATELAAAAVAAGADIAVAVGGDGTINEVARAICHSDTALGIIPCGSGNGLARHLGIPLEAKHAIDIISDAIVERMDYGKVDGIPFFCTCGVGFDAFISEKFSEAGKRGMMTYLENTLQDLLNYKPETYRITTDNSEQSYEAFLITCANASQYGNNVFIAPQASLSDGLMDVTILQPFTVIDIPLLAFQLFTKSIDQNSRIKTFKCRKIEIHRHREGLIHYDGDPISAGKELHVELVAGGINMVVNARRKAIPPTSFIQIFADMSKTVDMTIDMLRDEIQRTGNRLTQLHEELRRRLSGKLTDSDRNQQ